MPSTSMEMTQFKRAPEAFRSANGKPCFFQGPSDSPARCRHILRVLDSRCGQGNYTYVVAADCFDGFADPEKFGGLLIPVP
jgi:hypothetical protein